MPLVGLFMKAEMEGVQRIIFPETTDWRLDVQQSGSSEVRENITLNGYDTFETANSNVSANFVIKFEGAKQQSTMNIFVPGHKDKIKDLKDQKLMEYSEDSNGKLSPIVIFECRGVEPIKWVPCGPFKVETPSGKVFEDVDLTDAEGWCEYDEASDASVMISNVEFEFKTVK
eukprot:gnl/TRDRNA2_/TRDRNA2_188454_c0_seq1.p1 gnl/TRDRNA2_/TRDRNA2_188454_c0~~gnl/TRDRNA2_/TRDRNA2_188454_c0_seq1.p1  ORF type:complete len:172 (-),score=38.46 gnl/TRDRNA2_/TRDRNA2_188454_c0_seq1:53-568(-)